MRITAAPDLVVRDPETLRQLPAEGIDVAPTDLHWARLLRDGDVVAVPADAIPSSKAEDA